MKNSIFSLMKQICSSILSCRHLNPPKQGGWWKQNVCRTSTRKYIKTASRATLFWQVKMATERNWRTDLLCKWENAVFHGGLDGKVLRIVCLNVLLPYLWSAEARTTPRQIIHGCGSAGSKSSPPATNNTFLWRVLVFLFPLIFFSVFFLLFLFLSYCAWAKFAQLKGKSRKGDPDDK